MGRPPQHQGISTFARRRGALRGGMLAAGIGAAALALAAAGCTSNGAASAGGTPVKGGTAVYALPPSVTPNYIFPYVSSAYISDANVFYLQSLMYRPLYWFGYGSQPVVNTSLSLASTPTFSGVVPEPVLLLLQAPATSASAATPAAASPTRGRTLPDRRRRA